VEVLEGLSSSTKLSCRVATVKPMTIQRLENVGIVVEDPTAATTFFVELDSRCSVRCRSRAGHACGADWLTAPDANSLAIAVGPPVGLRSETHPQSLRAAGAQSAWYRRTGHQTCG
jgi:hypothetical protein